MKMSHKNKIYKVSHPTRNDEFKSPYGLNSVSDIQDYVQCIIEKLEPITNPNKNYKQNYI